MRFSPERVCAICIALQIEAYDQLLGVLYSLATSQPRLAPQIFAKTNEAGVPYLALLATSSFAALCFGSAFVGSGVLKCWT